MSKEKIFDQMYKMYDEKMRRKVLQILFNPTKEQAKTFWCNNCDGFHKTENCKEPRHE